MVQYNEFKKLYKVFGVTVAEKRAKRDGRNPATGAFSSGSHTGAVDLTIDVPMITGARNVSLPDTTKYSREENSADNLNIDFNDKVDFVFTPDAITPSNSTCVLSDKYGNDVSFDFVAKSGNNYVFSKDGNVLAFSTDFPDWFNFLIDDIDYVDGYPRRNVRGKLLVSGYKVSDKNMYSDFDYGIIFPEYQP